MLKNLFKYGIMTYFRNPSAFLYGIIFPIGFSTLFLFAFQGLMSVDTAFDAVPVAIVFDGTKEEVKTAKELFDVVAMKAEAKDNKLSPVEKNDDALLLYLDTDQESAQDAMDKGLVDGIVQIDNQDYELKTSLQISPNKINDLNSTIVYSVLDTLISINKSYSDVYRQTIANGASPAQLAELETQLTKLDVQADYVVDQNANRGVSGSSIYWYACLAYICIFFMHVGTQVVITNEANYSPTSMRITAGPIPKYRRFFVTFICYSVPSLIIVNLILWFFKLQNVPLGNDMPRIMALLTIGLLVGISMGTAIASVFKAKEGLLIGMSIGLPLVMGSLAGLMSAELKIYLDGIVPWLAKINPVSLINDALYYLNNYPTLANYNQNMIRLSIIAAACLTITLLALRRTDYESL